LSDVNSLAQPEKGGCRREGRLTRPSACSPAITHVSSALRLASPEAPEPLTRRALDSLLRRPLSSWQRALFAASSSFKRHAATRRAIAFLLHSRRAFCALPPPPRATPPPRRSLDSFRPLIRPPKGPFYPSRRCRLYHPLPPLQAATISKAKEPAT